MRVTCTIFKKCGHETDIFIQNSYQNSCHGNTGSSAAEVLDSNIASACIVAILYSIAMTTMGGAPPSLVLVYVYQCLVLYQKVHMNRFGMLLRQSCGLQFMTLLIDCFHSPDQRGHGERD